MWRATVFAVAALGLCASDAQEPESAPGRVTIGRLFGDVGGGPGLADTPPPAPLPLPPDIDDVGRAAVSEGVVASGRTAFTWSDDGEEIVKLIGSCVVEYEGTKLLADQVVIWHRPSGDGEYFVVYLDGNARQEAAGRSIAEPSLIYSFPAGPFTLHAAEQVSQPLENDPLYQRALARRRSTTAPSDETALAESDEAGSEFDPEAGYETVALRPSQGRLRRVRIFQRSTVPFNVESVRSTQTIPPEQVTVITGGVNVLIDGLDDPIGLVDLSADRAVIWTQSANENFESEQVQTEDTPYTVYLEGNIIIRQADRVIHATHAIYDAREERALMQNAELRAFIPQLGSDLRLRADNLRQLSRGRYHALDAWTTTSPFGQPGYRLQSREIFVEPRYDINLQWLGAGSTVVDPATGMEMVETNWVRSYGNTVRVGEVPILYSPYLAGPAEDINIPLKQASIGRDSIFGVKVKTVWDPFDLFGIEEPPGLSLNLLADYYSDRGPGGGLSGNYFGDDLFGVDDHFRGTGIGYYVHDDGLDSLGRFRNDMEPSTNDRYRFKWRHRHDFPVNAHINAELGIISDRNMLEQYFEREFDADKDQENLIYGTQSLNDWGLGNWSYELIGQAPINEFETVTGWYPKGDLWGLSEPLFGDWITWSSHTVAGYGDIEPADPDDYMMEKYFEPLPYAPDVEGANFMTRHQLDLPLMAGPVNIVPFAMGEAAFWEEGIDGDSVGRLTSSIGTRASVQFQRIFPNVYNPILGLNGLAHKIRLEGEYRLTDTSEPLGAIAQYNDIDDNAQERLRYRIPGAYFGGNLPDTLDPRFYGVRTGAGVPLGSPYYELIEDQQVVRLALRQRLQTKAGPPGRQRIRDWMTFDTGMSLFPNAERDNFGETAGLIFGNYSWLVSDRTKFLADAQYDLFDNAQRLWNVGFRTQRSRRGSLYAGIRHLEFGRQRSDTIVGSYSYVMSPKWISTLAGYVDIRDTGNTGESFTLTRVGADFLIHLGLQDNRNTNNFGVTFAIEPRFGKMKSANTMQLSSLLTPPINP